MRKSIFEILKTQEINIPIEVIKIEKLLRTKVLSSTLEQLINNNFSDWPYRGSYISLTELTHSFGIPNYYTCESLNNFSPYQKLNVYDMFNFFEIICNMLLFISNYSNYELSGRGLHHNANIISENIQHILEQYGYKTIVQDDKVYIVKISEEATAVAENYEDIAEDVIEYNRFSLQGNLKRKRELLYNLSNKFEEIRPNLNANCQSELTKDIGTILNGLNIRHNNKNSEYAGSLSEKEQEKWYDRAYDALLLALMQNRYLDYKKDIKNLRVTLKNN